jgi:hypothetical protein
MNLGNSAVGAEVGKAVRVRRNREATTKIRPLLCFFIVPTSFNGIEQACI